jgi:hypothetical protein
LIKCATGQKADDGIACENVYLGAGGNSIHGRRPECCKRDVREAARRGTVWKISRSYWNDM